MKRPSRMAVQVSECAVASGDQRAALLADLLQTPDRAVQEILTFRGPFPAGATRDFFDTSLPDLLQDLVSRAPSVFLDRSAADLLSTNAFLVLGVAIALNDTRFTPLIIAGLRCRSIYARLQSVEAITRRSSLRTPQAKRELQRLLTLKSVRQNACDRDTVKQALRRFES